MFGVDSVGWRRFVSNHSLSILLCAKQVVNLGSDVVMTLSGFISPSLSQVLHLTKTNNIISEFIKLAENQSLFACWRSMVPIYSVIFSSYLWFTGAHFRIQFAAFGLLSYNFGVLFEYLWLPNIGISTRDTYINTFNCVRKWIHNKGISNQILLSMLSHIFLTSSLMSLAAGHVFLSQLIFPVRAPYKYLRHALATPILCVNLMACFEAYTRLLRRIYEIRHNVLFFIACFMASHQYRYRSNSISYFFQTTKLQHQLPNVQFLLSIAANVKDVDSYKLVLKSCPELAIASIQLKHGKIAALALLDIYENDPNLFWTMMKDIRKDSPNPISIFLKEDDPKPRLVSLFTELKKFNGGISDDETAKELGLVQSYKLDVYRNSAMVLLDPHVANARIETIKENDVVSSCILAHFLNYAPDIESLRYHGVKNDAYAATLLLTGQFYVPGTIPFYLPASAAAILRQPICTLEVHSVLHRDLGSYPISPVMAILLMRMFAAELRSSKLENYHCPLIPASIIKLLTVL